MSEFIESLISGEKLQALCDIYIGIDDEYDRNPYFGPEKHKHLNIHTLNTEWQNPKRIFCYGQALNEFMKKLHFLQNPFLLISHNSDTNITGDFLPLLEHPLLVRWFGQNPMLRHYKLHFLPIGIGNSMWSHGNVHNFEYVKYSGFTKSDRIYFYFNTDTNPHERNICKTKCEAHGLEFGAQQSHYDYLQNLANCKYAICPPGYGIDCHRIYECYIFDVIPIVLRSPFTEILSSYMPCILLNDWDEFNPVVLQYDQMMTKRKNQYIDFRYYKSLIELIAQCIVPSSAPLDRSRSYSHEDNKKIPLDSKLDALFQKTNGYFIELGANNGITQSNTAFFEFHKEWSGILIEPSKSAYDECVKHRPNSTCFNYACVSHLYGENEIMGDFNGSLMSSVDGRRLHGTELVSVPARTLKSILDEVGVMSIDFLSVDADGYELPILQGMDLETYRPTYILIEINTHDFDTIMKFMSDHTYVFLVNLSNYNTCANPGWDGQHNDYLFINERVLYKA
jgi:FkbM family methyltransferase